MRSACRRRRRPRSDLRGGQTRPCAPRRARRGGGGLLRVRRAGRTVPARAARPRGRAGGSGAGRGRLGLHGPGTVRGRRPAAHAPAAGTLLNPRAGRGRPSAPFKAGHVDHEAVTHVAPVNGLRGSGRDASTSSTGVRLQRRSPLMLAASRRRSIPARRRVHLRHERIGPLAGPLVSRLGARSLVQALSLFCRSSPQRMARSFGSVPRRCRAAASPTGPGSARAPARRPPSPPPRPASRAPAGPRGAGTRPSTRAAATPPARRRASAAGSGR